MQKLPSRHVMIVFALLEYFRIRERDCRKRRSKTEEKEEVKAQDSVPASTTITETGTTADVEVKCL